MFHSSIRLIVKSVHFKIEDLTQHKLSFHSPATTTFSNFRFRKTETTSTKTGSSAPAPDKTGGFSFDGEASTGNDVFKFGGSSSNTYTLILLLQYVCTLGVSPSLVSRWREGYSSGVFEDLKFKISEGSDQN